MTLGLIGVVVIANGSILKALAMALVGLLLGIVGIDVNTGDGRFTFDWPTLMDGIDFVPIWVGIFGLGEIITNLRACRSPSRLDREAAAVAVGRGRAPRDAGGAARHRRSAASLASCRAAAPTLSAFMAYMAREAGRAGPVDFRQGRDRGRGGAGGGEQRRRADLVHPDADAGHPGQRRDGRHGRRADDPRHQSGPAA